MLREKELFPQFISKCFMSLRNIIFVELKLDLNLYFRKLTNILADKVSYQWLDYKKIHRKSKLRSDM